MKALASLAVLFVNMATSVAYGEAIQLVVSPGDTGTIQFDLANDPSSDGSLESVRLLMFGSNFVTTSNPNVISVRPGATGELFLNYAISTNATNGYVTSIFRATTTTEVYPDLSEFDASAVFRIVVLPQLAFVDTGDNPILNASLQPGKSGDTFSLTKMTVRAVSNSTISLVSISPSVYDEVAWDNTETYTSYEDLDDGTYFVTVKDNLGQISIASFTITAGDHIKPELIVHKNNCSGDRVHENGESSGTVHISITESSATDRGLGSVSIVGVNPGNDYYGSRNLVGLSTICFSTSLPVGIYDIRAADLSGNTTSQTFGIVQATGPVASLGVFNDKLPYQLFSGNSLSTPTITTDVFLEEGFDETTGAPLDMHAEVSYEAQAHQSPSGIVGSSVAQIAITGSGGYNYVSDLSPPQFTVDRTTVPPMTAGTYQMTVTDVGGGKTFMPFKIADLTAYRCGDVADTYTSTISFSVTNHICLASSLGLAKLQELNSSGGLVGSEASLSGESYSFGATTINSSTGTTRYFLLKDVESNSIRVQASLTPTLVSVSSEAPEGATSLTATVGDLLYDLSVIPSQAKWISAAPVIEFSTASAGALMAYSTASSVVDTLGTVSLSLDGVEVISGVIRISTNGITNTITTFTSTNTPILADRTPVVTASFTPGTRTGVFPGECNPATCTGNSEIIRTRMTSIGGNIAGVYAAVGPSTVFFHEVIGTSPVTLNLEGGITLELPTHTAGGITVTRVSRTPPLRYKNVRPGETFRILAPLTLTGDATISIPYSTDGLSSGQQDEVVLLEAFVENPRPEDFRPLSSCSHESGYVTCTASDLTYVTGVEYMVAVPVHETPHTVSGGGVVFQSDATNVTITADSASSLGLRKLFARMRAQGLIPVTTIQRLGPEGTDFTNAGVAEMAVNDATLASLGVPRSSLRLYQFNATGFIEKLPAQASGQTHVAAKVKHFSSDFALFGTTTPVTVDIFPPYTQAVFTGTVTVDAANNVLMDTRTAIGFTSVDPIAPYFSTSGSSRTFMLIDTVFTSTSATPGTVFSSTYSLSTGTHRLSYYGVDYAGNYEPVHVSTLVVSALDHAPPRSYLDAASSALVASTTVYVSSVTKLGFLTSDDLYDLYDSLGIGATQTFYAIDAGSFARFTTSFTMVSEGTHTLSVYSADLEGNVEATSTRTISVDITPPVSAMTLSGQFAALSSLDPSSGGVASGLSRIRFLVDVSTPSSCNGVTEDTGAAHGGCANPWYDGHVFLADGSHVIYYQAVDNVGNWEALKASVFSVAVQAYAGGVGIGKDTSDAFWQVNSVDGSLSFAHSSSSGVMIGSTTLEESVSGLPWSVFFDTSGRAYAVGTAGGEDTVAADVGVYRASSEGSSVTLRTFFDSGISNNDYVFGSSPEGWIVGAAQLNGPTSMEEEGDRTIAMGLWKFDATTGGVSLSTAFTRAGFDLATSLSVDVDSSLWVAGYSLKPGAGETGGFDLALWHYASNGHTLLGGPYLKTGYQDGINGGLTPRVYASTYSVYIAAPRTNGSAGSDMAFLRFDKGTSTFASEAIWRSADNDSSYPVAILPLESGFLVAGGVGSDYTTAMLWRFGFGGELQSAKFTDAGGARGAVYKGSQLWLSVDGSTVPYRVDTEYAASGALLDVQPPRTYVTADAPSLDYGTTIYVTAATELHLYAYDNRAVVGDGLGVGTTQTFYATDAGSYSRYASTFSLVSEGTHTVRAYSVDLGGLTEAVSTRVVAVDLTEPVIDLYYTGNQFELRAEDPVTNGVASGVGTILYVVDIPEDFCEGVSEDTSAAHGTCANKSYAGSFTVPAGTHTVTFVVMDALGNGEGNFFMSEVEVSALSGVTPSSGPVGVSFVLAGTDFGTYNATSTLVRVGGSTAPITAWSDTSITAWVPYLSSGSKAVYVQHILPAGTQTSATAYFTVTVPSITAVSPSSAPIGAPFTLAGTSFGAYTSTLAYVKIGGVTAPITSWTDTAISGTIPGALSTGSASIAVERLAGASLSASATQALLVLMPTIEAVDPASGPIDTVITVTGQGFGPYDGDNTVLLVGGSSIPVSVWADRTIIWTVPEGAPDGEYPLTVYRAATEGGSVESSSSPFTVTSGGFGPGALSGFRQATPLAARPDTHFLGELRLTRAKGGRVQTPAKAAVVIPAGALEADAEITLHRLRSDGTRTSAAEDAKVKVAGEPIEFGPEGSRFNAPVTLELPYDPALVADEDHLAVHYFNALRRVWEALPSVVDRVRKVVKAQTEHFSIYQPMGFAPTTAAQDEFYFRDQYAFPNPSRGGALVTFRIQPGLAETVEVRVYDLSGRKVHASSDFTFLGAVDDGNGKGAQDTYDHTWSVGGVGSGVYTYVIKASQRGQKPIVKSGKVGVIR